MPAVGLLLVLLLAQLCAQPAAGQRPLALLPDESRLRVVSMVSVWGQQLLDHPTRVPWPEYPRPALRRPDHTWRCLNGILPTRLAFFV
jgi:hypothetical protein